MFLTNILMVVKQTLPNLIQPHILCNPVFVGSEAHQSLY